MRDLDFAPLWISGTLEPWTLTVLDRVACVARRALWGPSVLDLVACVARCALGARVGAGRIGAERVANFQICVRDQGGIWG